MNDVSSAAAPAAPSVPGPAVDWVAQHQRLRARLRWLLPVGGGLLLLLAYQLATYPERAALSGYRYQQVGVQPDSTWWILAYRAGKAEILFSRDTARGWQRRALGVDSGQARSLALNWAGKALLVGNGGAVRVYDSLFRPLDSVRYPVGQAFAGRWVAVDNSGQRALIIGDSGTALLSTNGGKSWEHKLTPTGMNLRTPILAAYWRERATFGRKGELDLASRADYVRISDGPPLAYAGTGLWTQVGNSPAATAAGGQWATALAAVPLVYFNVSPARVPQLLRQDGSAESGRRHYVPAEVAGGLPADAKPIDAAFSPTRPGFCLLISRNRVFAGRLGGPFAPAAPTAEPDSAKAVPAPTATKASTKPLKKAAPSITNKTKKTTASSQKTASVLKQKAGPKPQPHATVKPPVSPPVSHTENSPSPPDTVRAAAARASRRFLLNNKSGPTNPVRQTAAPPQPQTQQYPLPANDPKAAPTKEPPPQKPAGPKKY